MTTPPHNLKDIPCGLERCARIFKQRRWWQKFCCDDHRGEYWRTIGRESEKMKRDVAELRAEVKALKNALKSGKDVV